MECCDKSQILGSFIDERKSENGTLISVLHKAQDIIDDIKKDLGIEVGQTTDNGLFTL